MGHVGLTPQTATSLGGYRAQGRTAGRALQVARDALALQDAGCFSVVFEAIPSAVADELMPRDGRPGHRHRRRRRRPTARCSCSTTCSASARAPARASSSATPTSSTRWSRASPQYADDVRTKAYPQAEHTYSIDPGELADFRGDLAAALTVSAVGNPST